MRILLLTREFPTPGQPTRGPFNLEMARGLAATHDLQVICPVGWLDRRPFARAAAGAATAHGIPVEYPTYFYTPRLLREQYGAFLWSSVRATVLRVARTFHPDIVLAYWSHPDGDAALRAARHLGVPGVVMVGGSDVLVHARDASRRRAIARVLREADRVIAVSRNLKDAVAALGVNRDRIDVVGRGVDTRRFRAGDRVAARRRLGIREDGRVVVWAGRMVPVKGLDVLAEACALLKDIVDFRLHLIGDGPLNEQVRADFARRRLGGIAMFEGRVPHADLADWFRAADVTVLPSRSEGMPNVLLESIACGTPFVASRIGGIPEIADPDIDRVVAPDDADALAAALFDVLTHNPAGLVRPFQPASRMEAADRLSAVLRSTVESTSEALAWA
jgi:teichuronic acid biosynthesis glycosyltransferase TuaC